jgi:hypothetical protein
MNIEFLLCFHKKLFLNHLQLLHPWSAQNLFRTINFMLCVQIRAVHRVPLLNARVEIVQELKVEVGKKDG